MKPKIEEVRKKASEAFWNVVQEAFQFDSGDMPITDELAWQEACRDAIGIWLMTNDPVEIKIAEYDSKPYDSVAMRLDHRNGNFSVDRVEEYKHENIVRESLVNGQFDQARKQCHAYGLNYFEEHIKFRHKIGIDD